MISNQTYVGKPKNSPASVIITLLFFAGFYFMYASMNLYDVVAMPLSTALVLWIVPGVVVAPMLLKQFSSDKIKSVIGKLFILLILNIVAIGSLVLYTVLAFDFYKAPGTPVSTVKYAIVSTGNLGKKYRPLPYADIIYKNGRKRFTFPGDSVTLSNIVDYKFIRLSVTPGYLGYDVIKRVDLVR